MCKDREETVSLLTSECSKFKLAQLEWKKRHDKVAGIVHCSLSVTYGLLRSEQLYEQNQNRFYTRMPSWRSGVDSLCHFKSVMVKKLETIISRDKLDNPETLQNRKGGYVSQFHIVGRGREGGKEKEGKEKGRKGEGEKKER